MKKSILRVFFAAAILCTLAFAQNALMPIPRQQFFDANGSPLAGGKVFTYVAGTTTAQASYTDSTGAALNSNPVILDSGGFASIWLGPQFYRIVVQNALGVQQYTADNVSSYNLPFIASQGYLEGSVPGGSVGSCLVYGVAASHRLGFNCNAGSADILVGQNSVDDLTNKTLFSPVIHTGTLDTPTITTPDFSGPVHFIDPITCKDFQGIKCIDPANSAGWSGSSIDAWIAAASSAVSSGGMIIVASGLYTVNATILAASNVDIECASGAIFRASATLNATLYSATSVSRFKLRGCELDGYRAVNMNGNDLVKLTSASYAELGNNYFHDSYGNGINLIEANTHIDILGNEIFNTGPFLPSLSSGISTGQTSGAPNSFIRIIGNRIHGGNLGINVFPSTNTASIMEGWEISRNLIWSNANDGIVFFGTTLTGGIIRAPLVADNEVWCNGWPANGTGFNPNCTPGLIQTGATASSSGVGIDLNTPLLESPRVSRNRSHDNYYEGFDAIFQTNTTVNTVTTAVTRVSGDLFDTRWRANMGIRIGAANYLIASVTDTDHLVITTSAGSQSGVLAQGQAYSFALLENNIADNNGVGNTGSSGAGFADTGFGNVYSGNLSKRNHANGYLDSLSSYMTHTGDSAIENNVGAASLAGFLCLSCLRPQYFNVTADDSRAVKLQTVGVTFSSDVNNAYVNSGTLAGGGFAISDVGVNNVFEGGHVTKVVELTAQTAAITTTTLYAVPVAGEHKLSWNAKVTTAAGTSSTLGALTIVYTDPDSVVQTITAPASIPAGTIATTVASGSTTTGLLLGMPLLLNCKSGTNVTYAFAYASNPANAMNYNLHIKLEAP